MKKVLCGVAAALCAAMAHGEWVKYGDKPVLGDEKNGRWMLWYNVRNGGKGEYIGLVLKEGRDLGDLEP